MVGFKSLLDLQWQPLPDQKEVDTVLQAETLLTVSMPGDAVLLKADQKISALNKGSFQEVKVRLPKGFKLRAVKGTTYSSHTISSDNPQEITVKLTEPTTQSIDLNWTLESEIHQAGGHITLEGFDVELATSQTGGVRIRKTEGYRIIKKGSEEKGLTQVDVAADGQFTTAYEIHGQPFRLDLEIKQVEPYFTAKPDVTLGLTPKKAELNASFLIDVQTDRGAVKVLEMDWPFWKTDGWIIESLEPSSLFEDMVVDDKNPSQPIRIPLTQRKTGQFRMILKATRDLAPGDEPVKFRLPTVKASSRLPTAFTVEKEDSLEVQMIADESTSLEKLNDGSGQNKKQTFKVNSKTQTVSAKITQHEQQISTRSVAETHVDRDQLVITQSIFYDVAYRRLAGLRLSVPQVLEGEDVTFLFNGETPLQKTWGGREGGAFKPVRCDLPTAQLGQFRIDATFRFNIPSTERGLSSGNAQQVDVPFIRSSDADFSTSEFRFQDHDQLAASLDGEKWKSQLSSEKTTAWITTDGRSEIPLKLKRSDDLASQDYAIHRAFISTYLGKNGFASSRAQYLIEGNVSTVVVTLPKDAVQMGFSWKKKRLSRESIKIINALGEQTTKYQLNVPANRDQNQQLLTIDYDIATDSPFGWHQNHQLHAPQFPESVWIEQTVWEIKLPANQHLFNEPNGFSPAFQWTRGRVFWRRRAAPEYANLDSWISAFNGPADRRTNAAGNAYQFTHFGPARPLEFGAMAQSIVVLIGAGLALAAGFLLLKLSIARNVLTILIALFAVALVSLWYAAPVQLLLQPAILGLLLAIAAALIDSSLKRERTTSLTSMSSPNDFVTAASAVNAGSSVALPNAPVPRAEEPTAIRPAPLVLPESAASSDVGPLA